MHLADLAGASGGEVEAFRLLAQPDRLELARHDGAAWVHLESFSRPGGWQLPRRSSRHEAAVVAEVITREAIELVHVQHLLGHTRDVLTVPRALDVPVVLTAHDYYLACPSHTLIDAEGHFCDGVCTPGESDCPLPSICEPRAVRLKHDHVHAWRRTMAEAVSGVDRVVSPSEDAAERLRRLLSETGAELPPWTVIEHGIDLGPRSSAARHPRADEPIRLVLVGAIGSHKGAEMLAALGELGEERNVLVEVLGELGPEVDRDRVRFHGGYERHELPRRLHEIRPTFVGILSGGAETFCYVVSEAWSCGVPVLVGPLGAPADRVRATGAGIVAPSLEPADVIQSAISGGRDAVRYALLAAAAGRAPVRSVADMAQDHLSVYDEVCDHRRESLHHEGGAGPDRPSHVGWA